MTLQDQEIERVFTVSTNLQGYLTQNVAPSLTGKIEHIYVEVGDEVKAGDMLVRMDQNQYLTSKIQLANLEVEMGRLEALLE
ncbi:MAG: biotin/lipoyl-binding protein, partial [Oscillospiraceae bacterium]|nr:biotin/lipoyl-binding protein [Oscillospiraceae bacterium]